MTLEFTPAGFDAFQNNITEVSTIKVGTASSTGTPDQPLQVGTASTPFGAYISGNLGIGVTNPTFDLEVQGKSGFNGNINVNNTLPITVSYASSFSVASQDTEPREVAFSNDGRTMYVLGNAGNDITWYTLSTPWSVATASFVSQFSVATQNTVPLGLTFKPDGTKFYIVGTTGTIATSVIEYSCITPWDLTTAGFTTAFSVVSEALQPHDVEFSTDGTKFYVLCIANDRIYQYNCTTPWSVVDSNVSYGSSFSVASQETAPEGFAFSQDGTKLLLTGSTGDDINYYTLSTPWDITTTSFVGIITAVGTGTLGETAPSGLYWKPDGTKLYLSGYTSDRIHEFNITSDSQLEVTGKTLLYGDTEVYQSLNVYGEQSNYENAYFYNKVGINGINSGTANTKLQVLTGGTASDGIGIYGEFTSQGAEQGAVNFYGASNATGALASIVNIDNRATGGDSREGSLVFKTAFGGSNIERARIDSSGRLLVGVTSSSSNTTLLLQGNSGAPTTEAGVLRLAFAGSAVPLNGDIGYVIYGDNSHTPAITILGQRDGGTWTSGSSQPSRLIFQTTADGAASPTERMRITSNNVIAYNQPTPTSKAAAATLTIVELQTGIIQYTGVAATLTLPSGTLTEGGFNGIYTNMAFEWSVINTGSGNCSIGASTGHTIVGVGTVITGESGRFASRRTAANTFVTYRLA